MSPAAGPGAARFRLGVLGVVVLSLFATLLVRLWYLQVMAAPELGEEAQLNSVRLVASEAPRGRILDREGRVLVDNRVVSAVVVDRAAPGRDPTLLGRLAQVLGVPVADLERRLGDVRFSQYKPVPVAEDVSKEHVIYLREHQDRFPGVSVEQLTQRHYPNGNVAAHLLGYVGEINDEELEPRRAAGYRPGDSFGKLGVERAYEPVLRGTPQVEKLQVDSTGRPLRSLGLQPGVPGRDVVLTIDLDVQRALEQALAEGLQAMQSQWDRDQLKRFLAPAGAAVVMDPRDGSVLAMASYPTYDPAEFVNGISVDTFARLNDPGGYYPLNNRAIQGQYAPGSTFKLVTALAALERGLISPRSTYDDRGFYRIGNPAITLRNAGSAAYGVVDLPSAIAVSSDVYFYWLGELFADQNSLGMQETARQLGLGDTTGIELPFEAGGRIPDADVRRRLHESNPTAFPEGNWYTGDNLNVAIGQGEMVVTPLQLANAYATFANGGTRFVPRVGAAVHDQISRTMTPIEPRVGSRLAWNAANREAVLGGLRRVLTDSRGTATGAFAGFPLRELTVAGKTGTAEAPPKQDTGLFTGFGPLDDPRYVVTVVMEESGLGSVSAAPVVRRMFEFLLSDPPLPVVSAVRSP